MTCPTGERINKLCYSHSLKMNELWVVNIKSNFLIKEKYREGYVVFL